MIDYYNRLNEWKAACADAKSNSEYSEWVKSNPEPQPTPAEHRKLLINTIDKAEKLNEARAGIYCPIAGKPCRVNCERYSKAIVHNTLYEQDEETGTIGLPHTTGGFCTAYILTGGV